MARNSENIAGAISAVNGIVSTQTKALAQIKTTLARKAAGASNGGWTKIGELTMGGTTFPISAYADGVITVMPQDGAYPDVNKNTVTRKNDYSGAIALRLVATENAGQYTMTNLDGGVYAPTNIDLTQYVIEKPESEQLTFSNVPAFSYYKARITTPAFVAHGARSTITSSFSPFDLNSQYYNLSGGSAEVVQEMCSCPINGKIYVRTLTRGHDYGLTKNLQMFLLANKPATPTSIGFAHYNGLMTIDTKIELWGRNDED